MAPLRRAAGFSGLLALALLALPGPLPARASSPHRTRLVVVLYPEGNDGRPGNILFDKGLRTAFEAGTTETVEIHNEYLDVTRFTAPGYQQHLAEFLRKKYAGRKVDLVVAGLSSALNFALKYHDETFPDVPIVFGAVEEREARSDKLPPDVVGVPISFDLTDTLDLALRLHPKSRRVFVVAGKAKFDAYWESEARQHLQATKENWNSPIYPDCRSMSSWQRWPRSRTRASFTTCT
jgi:hypothetical protein